MSNETDMLTTLVKGFDATEWAFNKALKRNDIEEMAIHLRAMIAIGKWIADIQAPASTINEKQMPLDL